MLSMSSAESMVFMWSSSAPPFAPQAVAYAFDRPSQIRSSSRVRGT
jgi:hypothetical protein